MDISEVVIPRADIRHLNFHAGYVLQIELISGPIETKYGRVARTYLLTFEDIKQIKIQIDSSPWLEILEFYIISKDSYKFVMDEGILEILCDSSTAELIEEVPCVKP
jgi:hypothetical protein